MKKFIKWFPFLLVFVLAFGMHVKLDSDEQFKPFLEPFGREQAIGDMKPNRPLQVLGDNRVAWLLDKELTLAKVDPVTEQVSKESRPLPDEDIYANTNFRIVGDDIIWVGNKRTLKRAKWQGTAWSQAQEIATNVNAMDLQQAGDTQVLVAGVGANLKIWAFSADGQQEIGTLPFKKVVYTNTAVDRQGTVHLGMLDQNQSAIYNLYYLTIDPKNKKVSTPVMQREISVDTAQMIYDNEFGIDNTHGYFVMTFVSTKTNTNDLRLFSFPLNQPKEGKYSRLFPNTNAYGAVLEPGQGDSLRLLYASEFAKSARMNGYEVFLSTLQKGELQPDEKRVSNSRKMAVNPAFTKQGDITTIFYTLFSDYERYTIYYNADAPEYAGATNKLTADDYLYSAMRVPQYMGVVAILMFYGLAWPMLSAAYLGYYLYKREDKLYDHAERHLWVAIILYLISQIWIFLGFANLNNFMTYSPEWMHSKFVIALIFLAFGVLSYLFTKLFTKVSYERNASSEFIYFAGINLWAVLLFLSYFMAK